jgi:thiamine biosynthesis lipoprotein
MSAGDHTSVQRSFRVMGCESHVIVTGGTEQLLDQAEGRLRDLESLWSRFLGDSDITRANQAVGLPVRVHEDTLAVVLRSIEAWKQTRGRFDITVLPALVHHGYTHSAVTSAAAPRVSQQLIGISGSVQVDIAHATICVPAGGAIDLGGIGKGFAADIVAEELIESGALGVLVNVGGDISVLGAPYLGGDAWVIGIEDPGSAPSHVACISLVQGGVATSGTTIRRWTSPNGENAHHLIDPKTALPAATSLLTATVIAGDAATAEVFATAAMMGDGPSAVALLDQVGLAGLMVATDLSVYRTANLEAFSA